MTLTDTGIRKSKSADKPQRFYDSGGLYLEVSVSGGKLWRLKYRFDGKEKRLALGIYPAVSLADARKRREAARALLAPTKWIPVPRATVQEDLWEIACSER